MGLLDRDRQHGFGRVTTLAVRKAHLEVDHDVGQVVAVLVPDLVRGRGQLELIRLGAFAGDRVDVHPGAAGERDQQQLDRGELAVITAAEGQRAAAGIGGRELQPGGADKINTTIGAHLPTFPHP